MSDTAAETVEMADEFVKQVDEQSAQVASNAAQVASSSEVNEVVLLYASLKKAREKADSAKV